MVLTTEDGSHTVISKEFSESYHSKHGAIQESKHVFINAALLEKIKTERQLSILGMGFGTGLNAYLTFLEAQKHQIQIEYVGVEAYPIDQVVTNSLNYSQLLEDTNNTLQILHKINWNETHLISNEFTFIKLHQRFETLDFENQFDIIYFDAFSPRKQPELWEAKLLTQMYKALKIGGVLTTYCAKGIVKRTLKAVGFEVEAMPGPPGKREMTRAWKK